MHLSLVMIYDLSGEYYSTAPSLQYQISEAFEVPNGYRFIDVYFSPLLQKGKLRWAFSPNFLGGRNQDNQKFFGKEKKKLKKGGK